MAMAGDLESAAGMNLIQYDIAGFLMAAEK